MEIGERGQRIADVLEHVEADDRVERLAQIGEALGVLEIDARDVEVRLAAGVVVQVVQVVVVDVASHVAVARNQKAGDVADAGADLEHPAADPGASASAIQPLKRCARSRLWRMLPPYASSL